jgi:hypothetical protein
MSFSHRALRYCLCARNGHQCNNVEVAIVRVFSCQAFTPSLTMPTDVRLLNTIYRSLGTLYKLRSSALLPVRRFNHDRSPTIDRPIPPLRTVWLTRALLKARSGMPHSDRTINYLVRTIIQTGFLATAWALAALATWFLLPDISVYRIFDITSGTVYTHVSVFFPCSTCSI